MTRQGLVEFPLWNKGNWPQVEVAGESYRIDEIRPLFSRTIEHGQDYTGTALLVPEPRNKHDANAVAVYVEGRHVGYLPREEAARYSPLVRRLQAQGWQPTCPVSIWGYEYEDWDTDRRGRLVSKKTFQAQARLVLDDPHMCVPLNLPPSGPYALLPHGSSLQVQGEENYLDNLRPFVNDQGQGWVYATLHQVEQQLKTTTRTVVELRVDGQPIGNLTPAMSKNYLPVIQALAATGVETSAKAIVKGNALTAEVVMHAAKAHELDARWVDEHAGTSHVGGAPTAGVPVSVASPAIAASASGETATHSARSEPHVPIPRKPAQIVFNPPPGWPPADGNEPPEGWVAPDDWPRAPEGWEYWVAR